MELAAEDQTACDRRRKPHAIVGPARHNFVIVGIDDVGMGEVKMRSARNALEKPLAPIRDENIIPAHMRYFETA